MGGHKGGTFIQGFTKIGENVHEIFGCFFEVSTTVETKQSNNWIAIIIGIQLIQLNSTQPNTWFNFILRINKPLGCSQRVVFFPGTCPFQIHQPIPNYLILKILRPFILFPILNLASLLFFRRINAPRLTQERKAKPADRRSGNYFVNQCRKLSFETEQGWNLILCPNPRTYIKLPKTVSPSNHRWEKMPNMLFLLLPPLYLIYWKLCWLESLVGYGFLKVRLFPRFY